ncbi:MAG: calcium/sodium antiporter [Gammaproteobacteria bacterium]|nr:calcium/sodium antiporter [Gammaproteobacteria bacterium]
MLQAFLAILIGFILLAWSADRFVNGAAAIARHLGISPLIVGLTIVGFGTSAPEMVVSAIAALAGNTSLAIGNAIGSNIANIGLVLGITAIVSPLVIASSILKREYPLMIAAMVLVFIILIDGQLGQTEGIILFVSLFAVLGWTVFTGIREGQNTAATADDPLETEFESELAMDDIMSRAKAIFWLLAGGILLVISSRLLVWGATSIATSFGISDLIIGLTIVAIGTSLPEIAASVTSVLKGENDIAIGNVLGSNIFNSLGVIGIAALIHPATVSPEVLYRDLPVMIGMSILLYILVYSHKGQASLSRQSGFFLLSLYLAYLVILGVQAI